MNNRQVAHLWANQSKPHARGSNFYFDGPALYSYGGHFCVGRIVTNSKGKRAYLLNSDAYSVSTSRHQHYARQAIAGGSTIFYVPGASSRHPDNRERFRDDMRAALARIPTRRTASGIRDDIRDARNAATAFNDYGAFFGLRGRLKIPQLAPADAARMARYDANLAARIAREHAAWEAGAPERARLQAEREAEAAKRDAERRQDFRDGKPLPAYFHIGGPCMLRLNQSGDVFQTSQGAEVPRADGVRMLAFIADTLRADYNGARSLPYVPAEGQAMTVGGFTLRAIDRDSVRIGCHVIPMAECAAMAALVGVRWPE